MGFGDTFKKMRRGRDTVRDRCDKNPDTGEVICKRVRVHADRTETDIAGFTMVADATCTPVTTSSFENEEGALEELEKKFVPKIVGKCKNTPQDY